MFSTHVKKNLRVLSEFILWSANAFNLDQSKNLSFGKELIALADDVDKDLTAQSVQFYLNNLQCLQQRYNNSLGN